MPKNLIKTAATASIKNLKSRRASNKKMSNFPVTGKMPSTKAMSTKTSIDFDIIERQVRKNPFAALKKQVSDHQALDARHKGEIYESIAITSIIVRRLSRNLQAWLEFSADDFWKSRSRKPKAGNQAEAGRWVAHRFIAPASHDKAASKRASKYAAILQYFLTRGTKPTQVIAELEGRGGVEGLSSAAAKELKAAKRSAGKIAHADGKENDAEKISWQDDDRIPAGEPFWFSPSLVARANKLKQGGIIWCVCARALRGGKPSFKILPRKPLIGFKRRTRKRPNKDNLPATVGEHTDWE
jgi:hypothetical protein